jgi:hypothetical protein
MQWSLPMYSIYIKQVNYLSLAGNNSPDPIFLTIGKYLPDFFGIYQAGTVVVKKSDPKIWSPKSQIR